MSEISRYLARYVVSGERVHENAVVEISDGAVAAIREVDSGEFDGDGVEDLGEVALVPGRVNAHSHAFQRILRGRTEYLAEGRDEDDFWSWRETMYGAALELEPDELERVARFVFAEMLRAGFTTVGEFHYLHHAPDGTPYDDPNELSKRMIRAAREVGIEITLLRAAYHRAGYRRDSNPRQRRFREPDVDTYLERVRALEGFAAEEPGVGVGLAPHSIRAVPGDWFEPIREFGADAEMPIHVHAAEQTGELRESRAEYGTTPIAALEELGLLSPRTVVVHATHATDEELDALAARNCGVCACPTTERNLGDGFLPASGLFEREVPVSIGTDSHAEIDPWGELRLVEYHERLREERRNVLAQFVETNARGRKSTAEAVWPIGGARGASALGREPARLRPGDRANFVSVRLSDPGLAGVDASTLLPHLVFAASPGDVADVFVRGDRVVRDGNHEAADALREEYLEVSRSFERRV